MDKSIWLIWILTVVVFILGFLGRKVYYEWKVKRSLKKIWKEIKDREAAKGILDHIEKQNKPDPLFGYYPTDNDTK